MLSVAQWCTLGWPLDDPGCLPLQWQNAVPLQEACVVIFPQAPDLQCAEAPI